MRLLICGDVVGRSGREAVLKHLPALKAERKLDFVIVNVDNAAGGWGITPEVADEFLKAGADVLTAGDHVWDQKEIRPYLAQSKRLLRPLNFPAIAPGQGCAVYPLADGRKVLVIHAMGQLFMKYQVNDPFAAVAEVLKQYRMGSTVQAVVVDIHAEATSEKQAMGLFLDGQVSAVVGSHTHVPTADARILPAGTAYQTDLGMCGDYHDTVIGWQKKVPLEQFLTKTKPASRMEPGQGAGTLCGAIVETDDKTGLAVRIEPLQIKP
jgi:metallophosphoesterase (TIGR00282 family)